MSVFATLQRMNIYQLRLVYTNSITLVHIVVEDDFLRVVLTIII